MPLGYAYKVCRHTDELGLLTMVLLQQIFMYNQHGNVGFYASIAKWHN